VPLLLDVFQTIPDLRKQKGYPLEAVVQAYEEALEDAVHTAALYQALVFALCLQVKRN
jgi:hypothetical protein